MGAFLSGLRECLSCKNCIKGVTLGFDDVSAAHEQLCDTRHTYCAERFCQNYSVMQVQLEVLSLCRRSIAASMQYLSALSLPAL